MNSQSNLNASNQNQITNFFIASSQNSIQRKQIKGQAKKINSVSLKISHYTKMILLSLGIKEDRIQNHRNFYEDFDFDIITHINLILLVESYFDIFITDQEAEKITTIQELHEIIQYKML